MFNTLLMVGSFLLMFLIFACLYRAAVGPTAIDRIISINVVGTKAVVIMSVISIVFNQHYYLDIAMVYAMLSYITVIGVSKYIETGKI